MEIRHFTDKRSCSRCGGNDTASGLLVIGSQLFCAKCVERAKEAL